jgi:DnaJ-class molecular chaperone
MKCKDCNSKGKLLLMGTNLLVPCLSCDGKGTVEKN